MNGGTDGQTDKRADPLTERQMDAWIHGWTQQTSRESSDPPADVENSKKIRNRPHRHREFLRHPLLHPQPNRGFQKSNDFKAADIEKTRRRPPHRLRTLKKNENAFVTRGWSRMLISCHQTSRNFEWDHGVWSGGQGCIFISNINN